MLSNSQQPGVISDLAATRPASRYIYWFVSGLAILYALLAGLHTVQDFDLGWQLASGRWVAEHHHVFSTDVFSYTASGQPWVYPALSGLIFYAAFRLGGYALLSWLGALASAGTIGLMLRRSNLLVGTLALVAVPLVANRTQPRAEMFTTILFAAFMALLWTFYRTARGPLWLLPTLMILWVNLHLGFVGGLALCGTYVLMEIVDAILPAKRMAAIERLRKAWPWLALTGGATLLNPWGPLIYSALIRQERVMSLHNVWVVEWESIPVAWSSLHQALDWRDPQSSFWWLVVAASASLCIAIWQKRFDAGILLAGACYFGFRHVRLQALFACVVVIVGGSLIHEFLQNIERSRTNEARASGTPPRNWRLEIASFVVAIVFAVLAGIRSSDLISDRYYMRSAQLSDFGTGLSWWYPERALAFLQREKLPGNIFNGYSLGGYLTWRLFPEYRDYIDSRAIPFGSELFFRAYDLPTHSPDSSVWQQEADARGINTIVVPLSRYQGMSLFPQLHAFCRSQSWSPVYLDEVSAIFVRRTERTSGLIQHLQIDCDKVSLDSPSEFGSSRARTSLFNASANAGGVLYSLERYSEAKDSLNRAEAIFQDNANVHLLRALVFQQMGRAVDAESEFRTSLILEPNDETWFDLGLFYMTQNRYAEAAQLFEQSARLSPRPHEMWMMLGQADLQLHQPEPALEAFKKAEDSSPFRAGGESLGSVFNSLIATGRAKACYQLGDIAQAVSFQEDAVRLAPSDAKLWMGLADLYDAEGRSADASQARTHAKKN